MMTTPHADATAGVSDTEPMTRKRRMNGTHTGKWDPTETLGCSGLEAIRTTC